MQNLKIKHSNVTLDGNLLSGDTYTIKEYIKTYLGGKWDAATKSWIVDTAKVQDLIDRKAIHVNDAPVVQSKQTTHDNGWCNKCHSWCYGDCTAN
jgi:hypothetical protein